MEPSFTDAEKRFVLAEMIKASHMDVGTLVDFVKLYVVQPDWLSMQVPGGRNLNQCLRAAEGMFNAHMHPPEVPQLKRKSLGDLQEHLPKRLAMTSPIESPSYQLTRAVNPQPHSIQPRLAPNGPNGPNGPSGLNGPNGPNGHNGHNSYGPIASSATSSSTATAPTAGGSGRRRGRPSKADKEAMVAIARANAPQTVGYAPISPAPPPFASHPVQHLAAPQSQGYSSSSTAPPSAYQTSSQSPDLRPKRKGRPASAEKQTPPASVPRYLSPQLALPKAAPEDLDSPERWTPSGGGSNTIVPAPVEPSIHSNSNSPAVREATRSPNAKNGPELDPPREQNKTATSSA